MRGGLVGSGESDVEWNRPYSPLDESKPTIRILERLRSRLRSNRDGLLTLNRFNTKKLHSTHDLEQAFSEKELQGVMMLFHYLFPHEVQEHTIPVNVKKGFLILRDFRRIIQLHMSPVEHLYLLNPFDEAVSSQELVSSLGKARLRGCLATFNYLHPTDLSRGSSSSYLSQASSLRPAPSSELSVPETMPLMGDSLFDSAMSPDGLSTPPFPSSPGRDAYRALRSNEGARSTMSPPSFGQDRSRPTILHASRASDVDAGPLAVIVSLISSLRAVPLEFLLDTPDGSSDDRTERRNVRLYIASSNIHPPHSTTQRPDDLL